MATYDCDVDDAAYTSSYVITDWQRRSKTMHNVANFNINEFSEWMANGCPLNTEVIRMDIMASCISELPDMFFNLPNLQRLSIHFCKNIETLPDSIFGLENLELLSVQNCKLTAIPAVINRLTNLRTLQLDNNEITQITDLSALSNLLCIDATHNLITSIGALPEYLQAINLRSNRLEEFPLSITECRWLVTLLMSENMMTTIPPEIANLHRLDVFAMTSNMLSSLPEEFGQLKRMASLNLSGNAFAEFPRPILSLEALRCLTLSNNWIENIPVEIGSLVNLTTLSMPFNRLSTIPREVFHTNLQWLIINDNPIIEFPANIEARCIEFPANIEARGVRHEGEDRRLIVRNTDDGKETVLEWFEMYIHREIFEIIPSGFSEIVMFSFSPGVDTKPANPIH